MDLMFDSSNSVAASYFVTIVAIAIGISLSYTPLHDFIHVTANLVRCLIGGDFVRGHARAIYNFYNAQLCHLSYLRFLGVANDSIFKGLEIGPFIMQESYEEAGKIPVCQYVTPCRNQLHMPLAAGALMQMWTSFHRNGYSAEGTLFLDIGCGNVRSASFVSGPFIDCSLFICATILFINVYANQSVTKTLMFTSNEGYGNPLRHDIAI